MKPEKIAKLQEIENALQELDTLLQNPLTDYKKISPKALAQIEQIRSITKQHRQALDNNATTKSFESTTKDDDIPKGQYVGLLVKWCDDLIKELAAASQKNAEVEVNTEHVALQIGNLFGASFANPTLPSIWGKLSEAFKNLKQAKVSVVCELLAKQVLTVKQTAGTYYKEKQTELQSALSSKKTITFPSILDIISAILAPADPEAAKKAQEAEEKRKAAEEEAELRKTFETKLNEWVTQSQQLIAPLDSAMQDDIISKYKFMNSSFLLMAINCDKNSPILKALKEVYGAIPDDTNLKKAMTVLGLCEILKTKVANVANKFQLSKTTELYNFWKTNCQYETFPAPALLRDWVWYARPMGAIAYQKAVLKWEENAKTAVGLYYGSDSAQKFDKEKLYQNLKKQFSRLQSTHDDIYVQKILPKIEEIKGSLVGVEPLNDAWKKAVAEAKNYMENGYYETMLSKGISVDMFIDSLPEVGDLGIAFSKSEHVSIKDNPQFISPDTIAYICDITWLDRDSLVQIVIDRLASTIPQAQLIPEEIREALLNAMNRVVLPSRFAVYFDLSQEKRTTSKGQTLSLHTNVEKVDVVPIPSMEYDLSFVRNETKNPAIITDTETDEWVRTTFRINSIFTIGSPTSAESFGANFSFFAGAEYAAAWEAISKDSLVVRISIESTYDKKTQITTTRILDNTFEWGAVSGGQVLFINDLQLFEDRALWQTQISKK